MARWVLFGDNQKGSIGTTVNHFGFKIMSQIDLANKIVLEVGPGRIDYNETIPQKYILADINKDFLEISKMNMVLVILMLLKYH